MRVVDRNSFENHTRGLEDDHKTATTDFNRITTELKTLIGGSADFLLPMHWVLTPVRSGLILEIWVGDALD